MVDILLQQPESLGTIRTLLKELGRYAKTHRKDGTKTHSTQRIAQNSAKSSHHTANKHLYFRDEAPAKRSVSTNSGLRKINGDFWHIVYWKTPAPKPSQGAVFHPRAYEKLGKLRRFIAQQRKNCSIFKSWRPNAQAFLL